MARSALFVIDIQKELVGNSATEIPTADRLREAVTALLERARKAIDASRTDGKTPPLEIVFVQHEEDSPEGLMRGSQQWELFFEPRKDDQYERLVAKTTGKF